MFLRKKTLIVVLRFDEHFLKVLSIHAPLKRKLLRANHAPYMSKTLPETIMRRSYLEKTYFKKRTDHSLKAYKKQKKLLQSALSKRKEKLFQ